MEQIKKMIKKCSCILVDVKVLREGNSTMLLDELRNTYCVTIPSNDELPLGNSFLKFLVVVDTKGSL